MGHLSFIIIFLPVRAVMKTETAWGLNCNYSKSTIWAAKEGVCAYSYGMCVHVIAHACMCFYLSSTQMCEGFFVPGPSGNPRQIFIRGVGKEDIQVGRAIQMQNLFQLFHV